MTDTKYSMSFTTATLLYRESITLADLYAQTGDWSAARDKVIASNLLQMRTLSTSKRICSEVISRLKLLTPAELESVRDGSRQEQGYMLWLAICKRVRLIYEFAVEIVREKYLRMDYDLSYDDYDAFFLVKSEWYPELERLTRTTQIKQRRFIFKTMQEADLLSGDNRIQPAIFSSRLVEAIREDDPAHFSVFPVSDVNIQEWAI